MLTHSDSENVTEGYIVDEDDIRTITLRQQFQALADFIDAEKDLPEEVLRVKAKQQRFTKSVLPGAKTLPMVPNKHTPKTRPSAYTTSRP